jgi:SanA protein
MLKNKKCGRRLRALKITVIVASCAAAIAVCAMLALSGLVRASSDGRIIEADRAVQCFSEQGEGADVILVLGCGVRPDGEPTYMLRDRLDTALDLYFGGAAPKILVSGDHGSDNYDEVNTMKDYLIGHGVPSESIFMDHAGFSTYESMYRASAIFGVKRSLVVTQKYHLYRALYDAEAFGISAYGVGADRRDYVGQWMREIRETMARSKDYIYCILKPEPTYLGESIDISGSGDVTNDK